MYKIIPLCVFLALLAVSSGQGEEKTDSLAGRVFRIGFIQSEEEHSPGISWYESLKNYLLQEPSVSSVLNKYHIERIALLPTEGYRDMLQRMDMNEFDLAFCSSVIFVEQKGEYRPILQWRGDIFDSRGQGMTLEKGVIIVGAKSPLFDRHKQNSKDRKEYIQSRPMAFVSVHNAVGYIYPRLSLWRNCKLWEPGDFIFCRSSEEVVKYVVSGLVEIGACEKDTFHSALKRYCPDIPEENLARILMETPPAPTNPIVIRSSLHPQISELGRAVKGSIKFFYNSSKRPDIPRVVDSRDENFKNLREEIAEFHKILDMKND
ncbi:PhnD/SsuA/transferrin family substrate-binding protein [Candidatus Sumerlaeota bacterium]|nr:PhnD/SsuA/transferrin family substrate-binding protein [Candidatus Sumerlaeota bacterium]